MSAGRRKQLDEALEAGDTDKAQMLIRRSMFKRDPFTGKLLVDRAEAERKTQLALASRDPEAMERLKERGVLLYRLELRLRKFTSSRVV